MLLRCTGVTQSPAGRLLHCLCYEAQSLVSVLQNLSKDTALFRPVIVNQVLGTDMKKHFDITSRFQVGLLLPMLCLPR